MFCFVLFAVPRVIIGTMKKIHESKLIHKTAAFICGLCLLLILLITATQAVCYWIPDWWRNEYAKYDTPSNVRGEMSLDDAVHVTEDMLEYCIGRLDTLDDTEATIDGVTAPFFTEREKSHLADCRELFLKGIRARLIACLFLATLSIYIWVHRGKDEAPVILARGYLGSLGLVAVFSVIIGILSMIDFTRVFTEFHHIFFDNDLWILYPDKDNLINIMQEQVFSDAAMWISGIWLAAATIFAAVSLYIIRKKTIKTEA